MLHWDPKPEIFTLPVLGIPILWYSVLFALGFIAGFPIFAGILRRFFLQRPDFLPEEAASFKTLNEQMYSEMPLDIPLSPRDARDAAASLHPAAALRRLKLEVKFGKAVTSLRAIAIRWTDRVTIYMIVATIVGARLGHFVFYEKPSVYLQNPLEILDISHGIRGLASHGAAIAIVLALALFAYRFKERARGLTFLHLLDFVAAPTALAAGFIRVGNFINQEILGTPTSLPWGVVFGHPADHSAPVPRHPVQLYEALCYFIVFWILWRLTHRAKYLLDKGKLIGWFLVLVFGFRLFAESVKLEQSDLLNASWTMGQLLSLPAILAGIFLVFPKRFLDRIRSRQR